MNDVLAIVCQKCNGRLLSIPLPVPVSEFIELARIYPNAGIKQTSAFLAAAMKKCECPDRNGER